MRNISAPKTLCLEQMIREDGPVIKFGKTFRLAQRGKWGKMMQAVPRMRLAVPAHVSPSSHLTETGNFGPNPGALRMFTYLPPDVSAHCALMGFHCSGRYAIALGLIFVGNRLRPLRIFSPACVVFFIFDIRHGIVLPA
jgi:hypothetical protein